MPRKGENIFKRKDGRWEARYIHHYENGVAKYRYIYGATYTQAKRKRLEDQAIPRCSQPAKRTSGQLSFAQISSEWLEHIRYTVKESTYARYVRIVKRYLCPNFSDKPSVLFDALQINKLETLLLTEGGCHGNPLSPKTVSDIICVFILIAKFGNKKGVCHMDTSNVKRSKPRKKPVEIIDNSALKAIESILLRFEDPLCLGILFALFSGVRIGELCGIHWKDINFQLQTVTIKRTIERIANTDKAAQAKTKVIINTPKTESSYWVVPLQKFLVDVLQKKRKTR